MALDEKKICALTGRHLHELAEEVPEPQLSLPERRELLAHVERCEGCSRLLRDYRETLVAVGKMPRFRAPASLGGCVRAALEAPPASATGVTREGLTFHVGRLAALLLMAAGIGFAIHTLWFAPRELEGPKKVARLEEVARAPDAPAPQLPEEFEDDVAEAPVVRNGALTRADGPEPLVQKQVREVERGSSKEMPARKSSAGETLPDLRRSVDRLAGTGEVKSGLSSTPPQGKEDLASVAKPSIAPESARDEAASAPSEERSGELRLEVPGGAVERGVVLRLLDSLAPPLPATSRVSGAAPQKSRPSVRRMRETGRSDDKLEKSKTRRASEPDAVPLPVRDIVVELAPDKVPLLLARIQREVSSRLLYREQAAVEAEATREDRRNVGRPSDTRGRVRSVSSAESAERSASPPGETVRTAGRRAVSEGYAGKETVTVRIVFVPPVRPAAAPAARQESR